MGFDEDIPGRNIGTSNSGGCFCLQCIKPAEWTRPSFNSRMQGVRFVPSVKAEASCVLLQCDDMCMRPESP